MSGRTEAEGKFLHRQILCAHDPDPLDVPVFLQRGHQILQVHRLVQLKTADSIETAAAPTAIQPGIPHHAFRDHIRHPVVGVVMVTVDGHIVIRNELAFQVQDLPFETGGLFHGLIAVPVIVKGGFMHDQEICAPRCRLPDHIRRGEHGDGDLRQFLFRVTGFDGITCHLVMAGIVIGPVVKFLHKIFDFHTRFSLWFVFETNINYFFQIANVSTCK